MLENDFQQSEGDSCSKICYEMDRMVYEQDALETVLVLDADRTLAAADTGVLFWQKRHAHHVAQEDGEPFPLRTLFSGPLGYSTTAFLQAALLYEEIGDNTRFEALCELVASEVLIHREFVSMLQAVQEQKHIAVIVLTCGLQLVWEKVLEKEGLLGWVRVVGNGRIGNGYVVTPSLKATAIRRLKDPHHILVWAFGDSPLDLPMLKEADQAIVVAGNEYERSKTMDSALAYAVDLDGLKASQVLLPSTAKPRLDQARLPTIQITAHSFLDDILCQCNTGRVESAHGSLNVFHATKKEAAKLLMTPMRDATIAGPQLREAHRRVGWYLAIEFLPSVLGIQHHPIPHVQGHQTHGFRLHDEPHTIIVALMRGGEPMAFGVSDAFPLASFFHAHVPEDIQQHHLQGHSAVVLVDSVMNSGTTLVRSVRLIRSLAPCMRITVILGVVQAGAIMAGNPVRNELVRSGDIDIIALRMSDNKFTGRGTTDTGNRLYNTTQLD